MQIHKQRISALCLIVLMAVVVAGCSTFVESQHKALALTQGTYIVMWGGFKKLYDEKITDNEGKLIVDDELYIKGFDLATEYYNAWSAWMDSMILYESLRTENAKLTVKQKAKLFSEVSLKFINLIEPYILKGGRVR